MKVLLIGNYENLRQQSMQRFAEMLREGLTRAGHEVRLVRPPVWLGRLRRSETGLGKWLGYLDRFFLFPWRLLRAARSADVVHICDHGNAVYVPLLRDVPHLVTCHDLFGARVARGEIAGQQAGWPGRKLAEAMLAGLKRAHYVVCVSEATRADLLRLVPQRSTVNTSVIENGLNYPYRPMEPEEARQRLEDLRIPGGPYLLHVGGNSWYKNRVGLLHIFLALRGYPEFMDHRLVLAGKPCTREMRDLVRAHIPEDRVLERTAVSNEDLRALYSRADALIFPSLEEGFGWPIIEAQACGCPVFTTNRPPMTEIGAEAAVYLDPKDPHAAAKTIRDHWQDRDELRRKGPANAARFSMERMIGAYLEHYRRCISDHANENIRAH